MRICKKITFLFVSFFFIFSVFSVDCSKDLKRLKVYSGDILILNLDVDNEAIPSIIDTYIKDTFTTNPVRIVSVVGNNDLDACYESGSEEYTHTIVNGGEVIPTADQTTQNDLGNGLYETIFDYNLFTSGTFGSDGQISTQIEISIGDGSPQIYNLNFFEDEEAPLINYFKVDGNESYFLFYGNDSSYYVKEGETFDFNFSAEDSKSSIISTSLKGITYSYDFENEVDGVFSLTSTSEEYTLEVSDALENIASRTIEFTLDGEEPVVLELSLYYTTIVEDSQKTLNVDISFFDDSFSFFSVSDEDAKNLIEVNFLDITNVDEYLSPDSCEVLDDEIICSYNNLEMVEFESDVVRDLRVKIVDLVSNEFYNPALNIELTYDGDIPEIDEFKIVNELGKENILKKESQNFTMILNFNDDSIRDQEDLDDTDYYNVEFILPSGTTFNSSDIECNYISNSNIECSQNFSDVSFTQSSDLFGYEITDNYGDVFAGEIEVDIDGTNPLLLGTIEIEFQDSTTYEGKQAMVQDDIFDVVVSFNETNFDQDDDINIIIGNFSEINSLYDNETATYCEKEDEDTDTNISQFRCVFEDIIASKLGSGTLYVFVSDTAGNEIQISKKVTVYESLDFEDDNEYFDIESEIAQPVNRNLAYTSEFDVWHEIQILELTDKNFGIENFQVIPSSCTFLYRENNSITDETYYSISTYPQFYPDEFALGNLSINPETGEYYDITNETYYTKMSIEAHQNSQDFVDTYLRCNVSLAKVDETHFYPYEYIEVDFLISFYGDTEENIIYTKAKNLRGEIGLMEEFTATFEQVYEVYKIMYDTCSIFNTVLGTLKTAEGVYANAMILASAFTGGAADAANTASNYAIYGGTEGFATNLFVDGVGESVKYMCDFVTCQLEGQQFLVNGFSDFIGDTLGEVTSELGENSNSPFEYLSTDYYCANREIGSTKELGDLI